MFVLFYVTIVFIGALVNTSPNFLIFYTDDLLYTNSWAYMAPGTDLKNLVINYLDVATPKITEFMLESIIFPRSYGAAALCAPARFSLLTGRYATRCKYAIEQTVTASDGTYLDNDKVALNSNDALYTIPKQLNDNGYRTAMIGKWHIMDPSQTCQNNGEPNQVKYDQCIAVVEAQGWTTVDGFYKGNVRTNAYYSHNPEWMVYEAKEFITEANTANEPFFLHFATTLAHTPSALTALAVPMQNTTRGTITEYTLSSGPGNTGMATRADIETEADTVVTTDDDEIDMAVSTVWIDEAFGALMDHLETLSIKDDTFVVFMGDHGTGVGGSLYEQGIRIQQFIRYPPYFGTSGHIMPESFIVGAIDLAAVIVETAGITLSSGYVIDGVSWKSDAIAYIDDNTYEQTCCSYQIADIYQSHAIVDQEYKYIFMATTKKMGGVYYEDSSDSEQLYYLVDDPNEQNNVIDDAAYLSVKYAMQQRLVAYMAETCPASDGVCDLPDLVVTAPSAPTTTLAPVPTPAPVPTTLAPVPTTLAPLPTPAPVDTTCTDTCNPNKFRLWCCNSNEEYQNKCYLVCAGYSVKSVECESGACPSSANALGGMLLDHAVNDNGDIDNYYDSFFNAINSHKYMFGAIALMICLIMNIILGTSVLKLLRKQHYEPCNSTELYEIE